LRLKTDSEKIYTNAKTPQSLKDDEIGQEGVDSETKEENHSVWLDRKSFRIALLSTFVALAIVLGYLLAYLPNIELFTLTLFLSGFILGKRDGMIVGFLSAFIFGFFNPIGSSPIPFLAFQLVYYTSVGLTGALVSSILRKRKFFTLNEDLYKISLMVLFGVIGAVVTTSYQLLATLIDIFIYFGTIDEFVPYFLTGIPFTITHIIGNTLGFVFILPGLIQLINKMVY
jgi:uncharacterized membrane protein